MSESEESEPATAADQRLRTRAPNRALALLLVATALVFLAGAVGVVLLVRYGPY